MQPYTLGFEETNRTHVSLVGGKGARLGQLCTIADVHVPGGFCITTHAFRAVVEATPVVGELLARLERLGVHDRVAVAEVSGAIRDALVAATIPPEVVAAIDRELAKHGGRSAYAVRSSATAEDSPTASFAGQHDTDLHVAAASVLQHVRRCWASLYTERAVSYRAQHGVAHRAVRMAVVVQKMVAAEAAGILFTADPATGHRRTTCIEATVGLGEALVAGLVHADAYAVREGVITRKGASRVLRDDQILELVAIGRAVQRHFGRPQDIEWCLADGTMWLVQSRPITTLFPLPENAERARRVYVSVGHQQMMTDALKPLGLSLRQLSAFVPMHAAGGRQFVDVAKALAVPSRRDALIANMRQHDPLMGDALAALVERGDFLDTAAEPPAVAAPSPVAALETDQAVVTELIERSRVAVAQLRETIVTKSGAALFDFLVADVERMKSDLRAAMPVILAAAEAASWLNENVNTWLGEQNVADTLSQSVAHNVTAEMGLALLDVADAIRPHPEVVALLEAVRDDEFWDALAACEGGEGARAAIQGFLDRYGMRCPGEIDVTRPRWSERPSALVPLILANVRGAQPGAAAHRFEAGRKRAEAKERELLARLRRLPDATRIAAETERMVRTLRAFTGYREYPKYEIVSRFYVYKQALRREAQQLVDVGVLHEAQDSDYLTVDELREAVHTQRLDPALVPARKAEHAWHETLAVPRVMTSDGEVVVGRYPRGEVPPGALVGLPVSAGVVEGRARIVMRFEDADLHAGDILVTRFADPGWTPLFVAIAGLVTEVGGLMTHGAVIAREYGLPAVVGVENATTLIADGQRIRVHGASGWVERL